MIVTLRQISNDASDFLSVKVVFPTRERLQSSG